MLSQAALTGLTRDEGGGKRENEKLSSNCWGNDPPFVMTHPLILYIWTFEHTITPCNSFSNAYPLSLMPTSLFSFRSGNLDAATGHMGVREVRQVTNNTPARIHSNTSSSTSSTCLPTYPPTHTQITHPYPPSNTPSNRPSTHSLISSLIPSLISSLRHTNGIPTNTPYSNNVKRKSVDHLTWKVE